MIGLATAENINDGETYSDFRDWAGKVKDAPNAWVSFAHGSETLLEEPPEGLSSDNVDITFGTPENGKVKFTAGPSAENADAKPFFMKVKVLP